MKSDYTPDFLAFWSLYPKSGARGKPGKADAFKAWSALKPDEELIGQMAAALQWQTQSRDWRKDGGMFIPYPATWLRGRRWEDEPPAEISAEPINAEPPITCEGCGTLIKGGAWCQACWEQRKSVRRTG